MSTATRREPGVLSLSYSLCAALVAGALLVPSSASAQAQTDDKQACINAVLKQAAKIAKSQTKTNSACLKNSHANAAEKLPGGTADYCIVADPKGKLAKAEDKLDAIVADCADQPDFGSNGGDAGGAGTGQARAFITDIFGLNLDVTWRTLSHDDDAAEDCQTAMVAEGGKLFNAILKEGLAAVKSSISGADGSASTSAAELSTDVQAALIADAKNKISKAATGMNADALEACGATTNPLGELARGRCGASDAPSLAECSVEAVKCQACRAINGAASLDVDCDMVDDSVNNDSCTDCSLDAHVIVDSDDLLEGPLADGQLGDVLIQNCAARFVIQKGGVRDMYSVGGFGGNIIDAELVGNEGRDNFLEIQPALNLETVVNAVSVEIVNDGSNGAPAVVRSCGPDDIQDFVNGSTVVEDAGLSFPVAANDVDQPIDACTEYILNPDATYLKMVTTVFNNAETVTRSYVGDFINAAGELEQWTSGNEGIGIRLTSAMGVLSYIGYGEAAGIDYGLVTVDFGNDGTSYFSTSGVSYILHSQNVLDTLLDATPQANFTIPGEGSRAFTRYFGVGDGSGANIVTLANLVRGVTAGEVSGCVTMGGNPVAGARVTAGTLLMGAIDTVESNWTTDSLGCFSGTLPEGTYGMSAWREGTPYEGGGSTPTVHTVSVDVDTPVVQNFALPATGTVAVSVIDENSAPVPGRISIVGFDPSPAQKLGENTGVHSDQEDVHPFGIVRAVYTDATGNVSFDVEPGSYQLYVSRGPEYSTFSAPITIVAGSNGPVIAQIARVIDTTGFVSSDHHVHAIASADSRVANSDRVEQFAGEGVDNIIMTDHHSHTDLNPLITAMGFDAFVTSTIGEEITTWDTGHYNAYPLTIDPTRPSGGSTDWGGAAPAGEDFVTSGSYVLDPVDVYNLAKTGPTSTADTVVQINHIDGHFVPMGIDTSDVPPSTNMSPSERTRFRMNPASGELFHKFDALELWNGYNRSHQNQFLNERIGIWFNHLNQGLITTMITDTDTHKFANLESAGGRSWSATSTDDVSTLDTNEVAQSVLAGKVVGGQGVYVQTRLIENGNPTNVADLTLTGDTTLVAAGPVDVDLEISVQAPLWAEFDTIRVYANAATAPLAAPREELFTATPTVTLTSGVDFTPTTVNDFPLIAGASHREVTVTVPFTNLAADAWFVVIVKGTDGVSRPMFPVFPPDLAQGGNTTVANLIDGNLGQSGVLALGVTNALYADVDGVPGFDGPLE